MTLRWNRLHAELGIEPGPLNFSNLRDAVAQSVVEHSDLDWKQQLPAKADNAEFAKDVAAMANAGGGLIVFGFVEKAGAGSAESFLPSTATESQLKQLRAWAGNMISPGVYGLQFEEISDGSDSAVLLWVPGSDATPHFVGGAERLAAPFRNGPDTRWLSEPEIERAYSDRFERRRSANQQLDEQIAYLRTRLDLSENPWIVCATLGDPQAIERMSAATAGQIIKSADQRVRDFGLLEQRMSPIVTLGDSRMNPRAGLRRWTFNQISTSTSGKVTGAAAEIRDNGSCVLAFELEPRLDALNELVQVPSQDVEGAALDFAILAQEIARHRDEEGPRPYHIEIIRSDDDVPLRVVDNTHYPEGNSRSLDVITWATPIWRFEPVQGDLPGVIPSSSIVDLASRIALEVLNQFGVDTLYYMPSNAPG